MRIVDHHTVLANNGNTITEQHLSTFFAKNVANLGTFGTLNKDLSVTAITEGLKNIVVKSTKGSDAYTPLMKMAFQWNLDKNYIKKVYFVQDADVINGSNREIFTVFTGEKYYNLNDSFALDNGEQLRVVALPQMLTPNKWALRVVLINNDLSKTVDTTYLAKGKGTIYRANYYPELSERGYSKFILDTEIFRNYLSLHRHSDSISQQANAVKEKYLESDEIENGQAKKVYYKFLLGEKRIIDEFMLTRENHNVFGKSNFDVNGKCLDQDPITGQDVPIGDGILEQAYAYASRSLYSVMDIGVIKTALKAMTDKSEDLQGNTFVVVCNKMLYDQIGDALLDYTVSKTAANTFLYSEKDGNVDITANFASYEFQKNKIVFMVNKALTTEYSNYGFGIMLDMAPDSDTGRPAISSFTLEGSEMLTGYVPGLGGKDGKSSGMIATGMTGTEYHVAGVSGIGLFNPYRSHIFIQNYI